MDEPSARPHGDFRWDSDRVQRGLDALIGLAFDEDRVNDDAASRALFDGDGRVARAEFVAKSETVVCGFPAVERVFRRLDPAVTVDVQLGEGARVSPGAVGAIATGSIVSLLSGERTALNFLQHLSGVATRAREWSAAAGPDVAVLDTRKTRPGWRALEKLAVQVGGAVNHRGDLAEFPMVKDNHRAFFRASQRPSNPSEEIAGLRDRMAAHELSRGKPLEVEVEDFASFAACVEHGVEWILIDNQTPSTIRDWIDKLESSAGATLPEGWRARLEASGGITIDTIADYAAAGVGRISVGALTHSVPAADWSVRIELEETR